MRSRQRWLLVLGSLGLLVLVGCDGDGGDGDGDPEQHEPGGCGLAAYEFLPPDQVGETLKVELDEAATLTAEEIDLTLKMAMSTLQADPDALLPPPYGVKIYRVRYTTQDKGQRVEATGLLNVPFTEGDAVGPFPLVLSLHGSNAGLHGSCAPSLNPMSTGFLAPQYLASQGFLVVVPDYIGLDAELPEGQMPTVRHALASYEQVAVGSLDMVRAAEALLAGELADEPRPTGERLVFGYSQGAAAALFLQQLLPAYAPELEFAAMAAIAPAVDTKSLAEKQLALRADAWFAGMTDAMVSTALWYGAEAELAALLTDTAPHHLASRWADELYGGCEARLPEGTTIDEILTPAAISAMETGDWSAFPTFDCLFQRNSVARDGLAPGAVVPTLLLAGSADSVVLAETVREGLAPLCTEGYQLEFLECTEAEHTFIQVWAWPEIEAFWRDRLAGTPLASPCELRAAQHCSGQAQ